MTSWDVPIVHDVHVCFLISLWICVFVCQGHFFWISRVKSTWVWMGSVSHMQVDGESVMELNTIKGYGLHKRRETVFNNICFLCWGNKQSSSLSFLSVSTQDAFRSSIEGTGILAAGLIHSFSCTEDSPLMKNVSDIQYLLWKSSSVHSYSSCSVRQ